MSQQATTNQLWSQYRQAVTASDLTSALETAQAGVKVQREKGNLRHAGIWQRAVANVLFLQGRYDEALTEARRAAAAQPDPYEKALSLVAIGQMLVHGGRPKGALVQFGRAAKLGEDFRDDVYLWSHLLGNRALANCKLGKLDKAIIDWEGAAYLMKQAGQHFRAAAHINSIGYELARSGQYEDAEQRLLEALELVEEDPHPHTEGVIYDSLGYTYTRMARFNDAERFLKKSARIFEALPDPSQLVGTLLHLSELHQLQRLYETAREDAFRALAIASEIESEPLRLEVRERLKCVVFGQLQENLGDWFKAHRMLMSPLRKVKQRNVQSGPWGDR